MKQIKKINKLPIVFLMLIASITLASCDSDDYYYLGFDNTDRLTRKFWEGDIFRVSADKYEEPLISTFYFHNNGTGYEELRFLDGEFYGEDRFSWRWHSDRVGDYIELKYGSRDFEFLDDVYIRGRRLYSIHYLNGRDFDNRINGLEVDFIRR